MPLDAPVTRTRWPFSCKSIKTPVLDNKKDSHTFTKELANTYAVSEIMPTKVNLSCIKILPKGEKEVSIWEI